VFVGLSLNELSHREWSQLTEYIYNERISRLTTTYCSSIFRFQLVTVLHVSINLPIVHSTLFRLSCIGQNCFDYGKLLLALTVNFQKKAAHWA
jgi:hypothetical protein